MPWNPEDALRHTKKANTPKKRRQWASVANSALAACQSKQQGDCEGRAVRQANAVVGGTAQRGRGLP